MTSLGACVLCHIRPAVCEHHVEPRGRAGSDDDDNLARLCDPCHRRMHRWGALRQKQALLIAKRLHDALGKELT